MPQRVSLPKSERQSIYEMGRSTRIGLISDTHGLMRPTVMDFLRGCDRIVHGGDIGGAHILEQLERIAPVAAVRGNNDVGPWASGLKESELIEVQDARIYITHDAANIPQDLQTRGIRVAVCGHSHKPEIRERGGLLRINPGSAGPKRFKLPIAIGELTVDGDALTTRIFDLTDGRLIVTYPSFGA
jgi:uncharacterized protein